jgi:hypothetical protein
MSYVNDPNDPNIVRQEVVVDNTVPPIVEAVEPVSNPLRWLWWLLGLLVLAGLVWALVRACSGNSASTGCTSLTPAVWTTAAQDTAWNAVTGFTGHPFADGDKTNVLGHLQALCNRKLGGNALTAADITNTFTGFTLGGIEANILDLVNGGSFCKC